MQKTVSLLNLLSASRDLANRSGILIRHVFESGNLRIIDKSAQIHKELQGQQALKAKDPQTIADITVQQLIKLSLLNTFPGISVIGEEDEENDTNLINPIKPSLNLPDLYYKNEVFASYLTGMYSKTINQALDAKDVCVWIDPIDGTKEYTEGIKDAVTCLIGIAYKGNPIAGIINRPFSNQTIFGCVDIPVLFFEKRAYSKSDNEQKEEYDEDELDFDNIESVEKITSISMLSSDDFDKRDVDRRIVCCSRSHLSDSITEYIKQCKPIEIIQQGGAGGKVLMILEGRADAWVHVAKGTKVCVCVLMNAQFVVACVEIHRNGILVLLKLACNVLADY